MKLAMHPKTNTARHPHVNSHRVELIKVALYGGHPKWGAVRKLWVKEYRLSLRQEFAERKLNDSISS